MLMKQKSLSLLINLALGTFGELLIVFLTKVNLLYFLYSTTQRCCLLHLQNFLLKLLLNSNLDDSGISLPVFPSRTNLKLHYISVTSKLVNKFITNLDLSKALFGLDCIPVVVLKNCELEFSYILPELFNLCLKQSCFLDCWLVPVFKNVEEMCTVKNYHLVGLLSLDSRVCERLLNNRLVDHLEKCDFFYFQYGFRSSQSTLDLLTVVSDRIARAFNKLLIEL